MPFFEGRSLAYPGPALAALTHAIDPGVDRSGGGGIASVKSKIVACKSGSKAKGAVKVQVTVAPEGSVSAVKISQTPDEALGTCAGVISKATFKKTAKGGSFSYPFVF